jgi:NTF2 fold immunity protein
MEKRAQYRTHRALTYAIFFCSASLIQSCSTGGDEGMQVEFPPGRTTRVAEGAHFIPDSGFVPNAATATLIAEAVLRPIYGEEVIQSQRPFAASLDDGVWTVTGSLPESHVGGVARVQLSRSDARVLLMQHGQ